MLQTIINQAWDQKDTLSLNDQKDLQHSVRQVIEKLDQGIYRIAEKQDNEWVTHQWLKKAVLLSFKFTSMKLINNGPQNGFWYDKIDSKFYQWTEEDFKKAAFRAVPNCVARFGSYIAPQTVLMPSFINIGAYIGKNTMIDTWSTIGSCAQIGENCHISGGVGIGGVLEPLQANPVIIEKNCFIGARSEIAEGVIVGEGSVIAMGVFLSASTKIVNRHTNQVSYGYIPPYSVVVPGAYPDRNDPYKPSLACAVIIKQVDEKTRSKTSINQLLREE